MFVTPFIIGIWRVNWQRFVQILILWFADKILKLGHGRKITQPRADVSGAGAEFH